MEKSTTPTNHILINAHSTIDLGLHFFAIIELADFFRSVLQERLYMVSLFASDKSFHNLSFWDSSCRYYCAQDRKLCTETIIPDGKDWSFVNLEYGEEQSFTVPKEKLEAHQLVIDKSGYANFKALSQYTNEVYMTESFSIKELLQMYTPAPYDSS